MCVKDAPNRLGQEPSAIVVISSLPQASALLFFLLLLSKIKGYVEVFLFFLLCSGLFLNIFFPPLSFGFDLARPTSA